MLNTKAESMDSYLDVTKIGIYFVHIPLSQNLTINSVDNRPSCLIFQTLIA
jgi:hypothetical protein